jgi:hypothetical protein
LFKTIEHIEVEKYPDPQEPDKQIASGKWTVIPVILLRNILHLQQIVLSRLEFFIDSRSRFLYFAPSSQVHL